jgi:hypothetical protein
MKKVIFILLASLLTGATAVQAQQRDTLHVNDLPPQQQQSPRQEDQAKQQQYRTDEMVVIESTSIPVAVRETLESDGKYKGWERSAIYQDPATGDYIIMIDQVNAAPKTHRLDKNGKEKKIRKKPGDKNDHR